MGARTWFRPATLTLALVLAGSVPARAQRAAFADALVEFHSALFGTYGDEGPQVTAALDRMALALDRWEKVQAQAAAELNRRGMTPADRALFHAEHLQLEAAVAAMSEAITAEPARAPLRVYRGWLLAALGRNDEAAADFRAARKLDVSDPVAAYLVALLAAPQADTDSGRAILSASNVTLMEAVDRRSRRPLVPQLTIIDDLSAPTRVFAPVGYEDGFRLIARRQFRAALASLRLATARDPLVSDPASRSDLLRDGVAALRARRGPQAIELLEDVVREHPQSAEARRVLAIAYRAVRRLPDAIRTFEMAVAMAPGNERARVALGSTLLEAGKLPEAEAALQETVVRLPSSGEARWALSTVYEKLNRAPDAIRVLEEANTLVVVAGRAHLLWRIAELAHLYHRDSDRVTEVLAQRARLVPNEPHAHKDIGLAYVRAGRDAESLSELLTATLLGHEDAETLTAIGQIHLRQQRPAAAETVLVRAVRQDPASAEARYALARALQRLGRAPEAATHLDAFNKLRQAAFDEQRRTFERESAPAPSNP